MARNENFIFIIIFMLLFIPGMMGLMIYINYYKNHKIDSVEIVPYSVYDIMDQKIFQLIKKGYTCEYELYHLSGGGYSRGSDFCSNENETIEMYWDFELGIEYERRYIK